jgi:hypothetical protein
MTGVVADAMTEALDAAPVADTPRVFIVKRSRALSVFDECEVRVAVEGEPGDASSRVVIDVTYDSSDSRVGLLMGFVTSVVGFPVAWAWRYQSVAHARKDAQRTIAALLRAIDVRTAHGAYR